MEPNKEQTVPEKKPIQKEALPQKKDEQSGQPVTSPEKVGYQVPIKQTNDQPKHA